MDNKKLYKEEIFDSYINRTIILSSKHYYKKQMDIIEMEEQNIDNEDYCAFSKGIECNNPFSVIDNNDLVVDLHIAMNCLSNVEQAVIFLLFQKDLTQSEAAEILDVYSKTVSKIKIRALSKLKKYFEGDVEDEK